MAQGSTNSAAIHFPEENHVQEVYHPDQELAKQEERENLHKKELETGTIIDDPVPSHTHDIHTATIIGDPDHEKELKRLEESSTHSTKADDDTHEQQPASTSTEAPKSSTQPASADKVMEDVEAKPANSEESEHAHPITTTETATSPSKSLESQEEAHVKPTEASAEVGTADAEHAADGGNKEEAPTSKSTETPSNDLTKAIFGDSDDDEGGFNIAPTGGDDDDDEDKSDDEDYAEKTTQKLKRLVKQKHKKRRTSDGDESGDDEEKSKKSKKKSKKEKRKIVDEEEEPNQDLGDSEEDDLRAAKRARSSSRSNSDFAEFDEALGRIKRSRPKKMKDADVEAAVQDLIRRMDTAVEQDIEANKAEQPATNKVKLLSETIVSLRKNQFGQAFVIAGGLASVKAWLDPLPDGSLPNLKIREELLNSLFTLSIGSEALRESGVGKSVAALWQDKRETAKNKKLCNQIIEKWSRPIFHLSSKYEDLAEYEEDKLRQSSSSSTPRREAAESALDVRTKQSVKNVSKLHAHIPQRAAMDFKIRPTRPFGDSEIPLAAAVHTKAANADRMINKKLKKTGPTTGRSRVPRAERMSIEGRMVK